MKPFEMLRATFNRYELAVIGLVVPLALGILAIISMGLGNMGAGIILFLIAAVAAIAFESISACPTCGKAPLYYYPLGKGRWLGRWAWGRRLWPERVCSSCGMQLDDL